jgi:hypothetical protein
VKLAEFLNGLRVLRDHQRESRVFGLILGAVVLLYFFKTVLSILGEPLMVVEDL